MFFGINHLFKESDEPLETQNTPQKPLSSFNHSICIEKCRTLLKIIYQSNILKLFKLFMSKVG